MDGTYKERPMTRIGQSLDDEDDDGDNVLSENTIQYFETSPKKSFNQRLSVLYLSR